MPTTRWRPYAQARKFIRTLEFNNPNEYKKWATTPDRPYDIPSTPHREYDRHWTNWSDYLGTKLDYEDARAIVRKLKIKSSTEYFKMVEELPRGVPHSPARTYKSKGTWVSWDDYLGRS